MTSDDDATLSARDPEDPSTEGTAATVVEGQPRGRRRGTLTPGTRVGRYVVQKELARGGMGVVYQARDPELGRGVAVKLVRLRGASSSRAREHLLREAQTLAQLSHPNVIAVHDVGTHGDDVFIAMELIEGPSLRAWIDGAARPWRQTIEVLLAAGRGLAAAHASGLVHRDFKPDNVMIGRDGRVRVLDFGVARPALATLDGTGDDSVETPGGQPAGTPATEIGRIVGTPGYMSPEQHRGAGLDALSDQFSFCVTAWEALCGGRLFPGRELAELRAAKEAGRLAATPGEARVPARIRRLLRRGLSPAPRDRFGSMDALLGALARAVGAPRRRAALVAATAAVAGALTLALWPRPAAAPRCPGADPRLAEAWSDDDAPAIAAALQATARPHARQTAARVSAALDGYARAWSAMRLDSCEATHVRHDQSAELLDLRTRCLDGRLDALRTLVGVLRGAPDGAIADHAVEAALGLPDLAGCADAAALRGEGALPPGPVRSQVVALDARLAHAEALTDTAQYDQARALVDELLPTVRSVGHLPQLAAALRLLGALQDHAGQGEAAATTLREAARVAATAHDDRGAALALIDLVWVTGHWLARYDEALAMVAAAETAVARAGDPPTLRSALDSRLGLLLGEQGHYAEAMTTLQRALAVREAALGADAPGIAALLNNLGEVMREAGQTQDAQRYYRRALDITERALGPEHPNVAAILNNLGSVLWAEGKLDDADPLLERSLALDEATFGPDHPRVAISLLNLGGFRNAGGRVAEGRAHLERALAIQRRALGPDHPELAMAVHNLGVAIDGTGDHLTALGHFQEAVAIFERALSPDHPHLVYPLVGTGDALVALGRAEEALPVYQRAIDIQARAGDASADAAYPITGIGQALLALDRPRDAVAPLERAVALRSAEPTDRAGLARSRFLLAQALWASGGDRRRARTVAAQARDDYAASPDEAAEVTRVDRWLDRHR